MSEPIEITVDPRDSEVLAVTSEIYLGWATSLDELREEVRFAGSGPVHFSQEAWTLLSSWLPEEVNMKYLIQISQPHRGGQTLGFRGTNDAIVGRDLATRYPSIEAARREAQELEEDDSEKRCTVVIA